MKTRIITAFAILAVIIPSLLFGGVLIDLLTAIIVAGCGYEYLKLCENKQPPLIMIATTIASFAIIYLPIEYVLITIGLAILVLFAIPVFYERFTSKDAFVYVSFIIFIYCIASSFKLIYNANPMFIWMIIIATYACDTGAYFTGYFFGKHKLNERVSPKKTIEGSIGGFVIGAIASFTFAHFCISGFSTTALAIACIIMPITGQIGDLAFSAMKRNFNIKDFSNIFPGHGGMLDRLDSLIYNFIIFSFIYTVVIML
ncbi:MAG: phosphatidate cytidylyltransferase [Erysipelotrichaceae bacterium]